MASPAAQDDSALVAKRSLMARNRFVMPILFVGIALLLAPAAAGASGGQPVIDADPAECTSALTPEEMPAFDLTTDPRLDLDVRILAESRDLRTAKQHMRTTVAAYDRIGIEVDATYDSIEVPEEWNNAPELFPDRPAEDLWKLIKNHYNGVRPKGVDLVYYFTRYWGGGMADCIGGVRYPDTAFAFGSIDYAIESTVPAPHVDEGVIAAHELGHLLGAHHHYSDCAAAPVGATYGWAAVCTTMSPLATTASPVFGTLEQSFVRHYTEKYAQ